MRISLNGYVYLLTFCVVSIFLYLSVFSSAEDTAKPTEKEPVVKKAEETPESEAKSDSKSEDGDKPAAPAEQEPSKEEEKPKGDAKSKAEDEPKEKETSKSEENSETKSEEKPDETKDAKAAEPETGPMPEVTEDKPETEDEPKTEQPAPAIKLVLPTDNDHIYGDEPKFYMHTNRYIDGVNTRPWQGGSYGYVRNRLSTRIGTIYTRFHEGIDIRPLKRDSRNMPLDDVYTMADGTVVYVNSSSSRSSYGRYVVVRHDWDEGIFYSLYAHLASCAVKADQEVKAGDVLGRLGYSGVGLDRERAHVHVELNFLLSERYASHYGSGHKNYNGLNMIGIDLGRFLKAQHASSDGLYMKDFLAEEDPYCKVRTSSSKMPGILKRHPWLGKDMEKADDAKSWEFTFAQTGVPLSIAPCEESYRYSIVSWVKDVNTNHSYMSMGKLLGSGSKAKLSSKGHRYIKLISEAF